MRAGRLAGDCLAAADVVADAPAPPPAPPPAAVADADAVDAPSVPLAGACCCAGDSASMGVVSTDRGVDGPWSSLMTESDLLDRPVTARWAVMALPAPAGGRGGNEAASSASESTEASLTGSGAATTAAAAGAGAWVGGGDTVRTGAGDGVPASVAASLGVEGCCVVGDAAAVAVPVAVEVSAMMAQLETTNAHNLIVTLRRRTEACESVWLYLY